MEVTLGKNKFKLETSNIVWVFTWSTLQTKTYFWSNAYTVSWVVVFSPCTSKRQAQVQHTTYASNQYVSSRPYHNKFLWYFNITGI